MATTYNDQKSALDALTNSLVFENTTRAITGTGHNAQELGQNSSAFDNLVAYDNYAYKVVRTCATATENGQSLKDAYEDAKTLTPNGAALSANNRAALLIPPGTYSFGTDGLELDTQFIDLIGVGKAEETILTSVSDTGTGLGTIIQTTNDIIFKNLTIQNTANTYDTGTDQDDSGYAPQNVFPSVRFEDCIFRNPAVSGGAPFMRLAFEYSGTFIRCRGIDATGNSVFFPIASGNYFDCHYAGNGFGYGGEASGIFTDCSCSDGFGFFADASGSFTRCTAFNSGFGSVGNASGNFSYCAALTESYGYGDGVTCSGTFVGCKANDNSFGGSTSSAVFRNCSVSSVGFGASGGLSVTMAGTYINCDVADDGFGCNSSTVVLSGRFYGCTVSGVNGFGANNTSTLSGFFENCSVGSVGFGSDSCSLTGVFINCQCGDYGFGWGGGDTVSGKFINCSSGPRSFNLAYNGSNTAEYVNCSAGEKSFGYIANQPAIGGPWTANFSPKMTNCCAGDDSFGRLDLGGFRATSLQIDGEFHNCTAGDNSFGCTNGVGGSVSFTGKAYNCTAGNFSFCTAVETPGAGSHLEEFTGVLENCHAGPGSFAAHSTSSKSGVLNNCSVYDPSGAVSWKDEGALDGIMTNCNWLAPESGEAAIVVSSGAKVYGGRYLAGQPGAPESITSSGAVTASIANVLLNAPLGGSITNNITSPNVIVDSDI